MKFKCFIAFVVMCLIAHTNGQSNRVKFHDLGQQTFKVGLMTNARRVSPIPQVQCVSGYGSPDCSMGPTEITCEIVEKFGVSDAIWKCVSVLGSSYKISKYEVSCEGYSHAGDPYVLAGSCGVEYVLDLTEEGIRLRDLANAREKEYQTKLAEHNRKQSEQQKYSSHQHHSSQQQYSSNIYDEAQRRADKTGKPQVVVEETVHRRPLYYDRSKEDKVVAMVLILLIGGVAAVVVISMLISCVSTVTNCLSNCFTKKVYVHTTEYVPPPNKSPETGSDDSGMRRRHTRVNESAPPVSQPYGFTPVQPSQQPHITIVSPPVRVFSAPPVPVFSAPVPIYVPPVVETRTVKTTIVTPQQTKRQYSPPPPPPPPPPSPVNVGGKPTIATGFASTKNR
jgi:hypothetical protein